MVGTHGRSFWILDNVTPLRQLVASGSGNRVAGSGTSASASATRSPPPATRLFKPQTAIRIRYSQWPDTPLPPDEPAGENPPDGAIIDYVIGSDGAGGQPVTLEILDGTRLVRRYASTDTSLAPVDIGNVPRYWIRPTRVLPATPGMHRFVWDLRYPEPRVLSVQYPISGTPANTAREPRGPWVVPGTYTVRLTVNGKTYTQPLTVRMDPRVKTPATTLARQFALSKGVYDDIARTRTALDSVRALRASLRGLRQRSAGDAAAIDSLDREAGGARRRWWWVRRRWRRRRCTDTRRCHRPARATLRGTAGGGCRADHAARCRSPGDAAGCVGHHRRGGPPCERAPVPGSGPSFARRARQDRLTLGSAFLNDWSREHDDGTEASGGSGSKQPSHGRLRRRRRIRARSGSGRGSSAAPFPAPPPRTPTRSGVRSRGSTDRPGMA